MKTRIVNCLIVGFGAFSGSAIIQYLGSAGTVDFTKAAITGVSFLVVMSIYILVSMRNTSK
jgi:hypothetical protein